MKKRLFPTLAATAIFAALIVTGCKKENSADGLSPEQEASIATTSTEQEADLDVAMNDVFDNVMGVDAEVGIGGTGIFGKMTDDGRQLRTDTARCFTVSRVRLNAPAPFPVKVTIDFGNGCTGRDGKVRSGKIVITYTGPMIVPGNSATTVFENHKVDSLLIQGTHKIANTTTPGANQRQFTITATEMKLTHNNGNFSMWSGTRVITQTEGNGTPQLPIDDIFNITGSGQGRVKKGNELFGWQSEITEPLVKKFTCRWITKGIIKVRRQSTSSNNPWVATLDFGSGTCDNKATLTVNGVIKQITLR